MPLKDFIFGKIASCKPILLVFGLNLIDVTFDKSAPIKFNSSTSPKSKSPDKLRVVPKLITLAFGLNLIDVTFDKSAPIKFNSSIPLKSKSPDNQSVYIKNNFFTCEKSNFSPKGIFPVPLRFNSSAFGLNLTDLYP